MLHLHLINVGLLILRLMVGLLLFAHGAQKLLGWFGGGGPAGTMAFIGSLGLRPVGLFATANTLGEFLGGLGLAFGLLTPFAAVGAMGSMIVAIATVHWTKGFFNHEGGFEFPLTLAAVAFVLGFVGPGRYSLDAALGLRYPWPWTLVVLMVLMLAFVLVAILRSAGIRRQGGK